MKLEKNKFKAKLTDTYHIRLNIFFALKLQIYLFSFTFLFLGTSGSDGRIPGIGIRGVLYQIRFIMYSGIISIMFFLCWIISSSTNI